MMDFLPKTVKWIDPSEASSKAYRKVFIATHKHSVRDWQVIFGSIVPRNNYTEYDLVTEDGRKIELDKVLAIGLFTQYGML